MGKQANGSLIAHLPLVFVSTFAVVIAPMLLVFWLRESGAVTSMWVALAIGVSLSLVASQAGAALWKSRAHSDLLFNELMVWGWLQRWRSERRLAAATGLLGLTVGRPEAISGGHLTSAQKELQLTRITSSLEGSDPYTHGHSRRVARHAANIAKQMNLTREQVAKIRAAGAVHDVGKVETPTAVLHKAGKLTDEEFEIVKRHPVDGANMVAALDDDELTAIVRHHHERLDGTGYPDGLAGEEIPLGARIMAVADTFDAITSTRPYRRANPHKKALDILAAEAGTQLDPRAVNAFRECYSGRKPLTFWAVLLNSRPRVESLLGQGLTPASTSNVLATAAAAAAVGAVAIGPAAGAIPTPSTAPGASDAVLASANPFTRSPASSPVAFASFVPEEQAGSARSGSGDEASAGSGASDPAGPKSAESGDSAPGGGSVPSDSRRQAAQEDAPSQAQGDDDTAAPGARPQNAAPNAKGRRPATNNGNNGHHKGNGKGNNGKGNGYGHVKVPKQVPAKVPVEVPAKVPVKVPPVNLPANGNGNGNGPAGGNPGKGNGNGNGNGLREALTRE